MANQHDLAEQLLQRASDDEAAARAMLPIESVTDMIVGTLAQQAVEKSIKAVLVARGVDFPFTHDIGGLVRICNEAEAPLPDDLGEADQLTPYAGAVRYDAEDPKLIDRATALSWATAAVAWARAQVESAAAPAAETEDQEGT
ncbi:MAG TPA: HEPN domain-containing protein [Solirubrobacteraceae bacterium]|nr:HEPN domain-containing protein [Solirubrobacteraceae bacterium]